MYLCQLLTVNMFIMFCKHIVTKEKKIKMMSWYFAICLQVLIDSCIQCLSTIPVGWLLVQFLWEAAGLYCLK